MDIQLHSGICGVDYTDWLGKPIEVGKVVFAILDYAMASQPFPEILTDDPMHCCFVRHDGYHVYEMAVLSVTPGGNREQFLPFYESTNSDKLNYHVPSVKRFSEATARRVEITYLWR